MSELSSHNGDGIRYSLHLSAPKGGVAQMLRDPEGAWVPYEEHARLKAEVERLTKAGKLMDTVSEEWERIQKGTSGGCDILYAVSAWRAAKEGKGQP